MKLKRIRIVRKPRRLSDPKAFFTLEGYRLVNDYGGRRQSPEYSCESVHRRGTDGVAIAVWRRNRGRAEVLLKECIRPPVLFRAARVGAKRPNPPLLLEVIAGSREPRDRTAADLRQRAAEEIFEEAGIRVPVARIRRSGPPAFTSPGGLSEEVHIYTCEVTGLPQLGAQLDNAHPLELHSPLHWLSIETALRWTRTGRIRDAKTEIAIRRLADSLQP